MTVSGTCTISCTSSMAMAYCLTVDVEADQLQLIARVLFLTLLAGGRGARHAAVFEIAAICANSRSMSLAKSSHHDHGVAAHILDEAGKHLGIHRSANGATSRCGRHRRRLRSRPVDHEAQRLAHIHHQGACGIIMGQLGKAEKAAQRDDGQYLAAQLRQPSNAAGARGTRTTSGTR